MRLMFYSREGSTYRPLISIAAYLITVAAGSVSGRKNNLILRSNRGSLYLRI
ncbi:phage holin family protein [Serratia sp. DD3]|uniref:phage holin family protein n=1 Tax=Serratia sp. DD3 TaxID=1410619 RepID=UPI00350F0F00